MVWREAASGNNAVHMYMILKLLVPGMEHLYDARNSSEMFFISGKLQKRFGAAFVEQAVKKLLIAAQKRVEFMWKGKNHMEVRGIYHFRPALIHPDFLADCLTAGTVSVAAGICMDLQVSAFRANTGTVPEFSSPAPEDVMRCFFLDGRLENAAFTIGIIRILENFLNSSSPVVPGSG